MKFSPLYSSLKQEEQLQFRIYFQQWKNMSFLFIAAMIKTLNELLFKK